MSPRILFILAVACLSQGGISAEDARKDTIISGVADFNSSVQARSIFGCIPRLWDAVKVAWDIRNTIKAFANIRSELTKAIAKCKEMDNEENEKKCREEAQRVATEKTEQLVAGVQNLVSRVLTLLHQFKQCLYG